MDAAAEQPGEGPGPEAVRRAYERVRAALHGRIEPLSDFREAWRFPAASCWVSGDTEITVPLNWMAKGADSILFFGRGATTLLGCHVTGPRSVVYIGPYCDVQTSSVVVTAPDSLCAVGAFSVLEAAGLQLFASSGSLLIGEACYFGTASFASNSDTHGIYDLAGGQRINHERDVRIGDHVFVGLETSIGKGATIGDGAMVLQRSVVTGALQPGGLYWGVPATLRREGVAWFHATDLRETVEESRLAEAARLDPLRAVLEARYAEAGGPAP